MTVQYVTDHDAFENALVAWLRDYALFNDRVRYANQDTARPTPPYATYQIIADGSIEGVDALHEVWNETLQDFETVLYGPRRMTVQVVVFTTPGSEDVAGRSARMRLNGALAALRSRAGLKLFDDAGLAFLQVVGAPLASDEQLGDRWLRRMQVDIELGYTSLVTTTGEGEGWFDKIPIDLEDSGNFTVPRFVVTLEEG